MNTMITLDELKVVCPAAYSNDGAKHVSERYTPVRSADIVEKLVDQGFVITHATQQKTQKAKAHKEAHQKHRIRLRLPGVADNKSRGLGNVFPSIDLINSGDWSSKLMFAMGLYRMVCENGMIAPFAHGVANTTINARHDNLGSVDWASIDEAIKEAPKLFTFAGKCEDAVVSDHDQRAYAAEAARLRWDFEEDETPTKQHIDGLLRAHREEDTAPTLWTLFNRVQENGTRGGFSVPSGENRLRRVRARSNIKADLEWNQGLWSITEDMLRAVSPN